MNKTNIIRMTGTIVASLLLCFLAACGETDAEAATVKPAATAVPVITVDGTEYSADVTEIDYSGNLNALTEAAAELGNLTVIRLGTTDASAKDLAALAEAFPKAEISFETVFHGISCGSSTTSLDLSALKHEDAQEAAALLKVMPALKTVQLTTAALSDSESVAETVAETEEAVPTASAVPEASEPLAATETAFTMDDYVLLHSARPDIKYTFAFELYGKTVTQDTETLKFKKVEIGNEGLAKFKDYIPCLPALTYLSFDRCETDSAAAAELRDAFPSVKIVWRIFFGRFSVMTDDEKIWAIGSLTDNDTEELKYCTDMKYVDLGHNDITKIEFVRYMPKLEVLIIACTKVDDITPLEDCPNLEFLELTVSNVSDISTLAGCSNLRHLEISQLFQLTDISPLYNLQLERMHAMADFNVPQEQKDKFAELHPDCDMNFNPTDDPFQQSNWRYTNGYDGGDFVPRYALLREQIGYDDPYGTSVLYDWMDYDDEE